MVFETSFQAVGPPMEKEECVALGIDQWVQYNLALFFQPLLKSEV